MLHAKCTVLENGFLMLLSIKKAHSFPIFKDTLGKSVYASLIIRKNEKK